MADLARIKSNVAKMISMNAPESDIDGYIASEGVTIDDVRDFGKDYTTGRIYTIDRGLSFGTGRKLQGLYDAAIGKIGDLGEASGEVVANIQNKGLKDAFSDISEKPSFWEHYHNTVDPIMEKVDEYYQNRPVEAFMLETGAGLANPTNKVGLGYINKGKTLGAKTVRSGVVGTGIGSVAGGMNTENTEDFIPNTAVGMAIGGALGSALPLAGNVIGGAYNKGKALFNPEASVAGKETGLGNIVKDNDSVRILKRGIMAGDDVATQVSEQAPAVMDALNKEMSDIVDNTIGRKIDYKQAIGNQRERLHKFIGANKDVELYSPKTAEQQAQENFNRWFDGSQVVDENGQPRRYYHGSLRNFDKFKQGNNDYNFAPDEKFAYNYAENKAFEQGIDAEPKVYEVFLKSKKPFDFENPQDIQNLSDYIGNKAIKVFGNPKEKNDFLSNLKGEYYDTDLRKGEFEKLFDENAFYPYNWYDGTNKIVDQTYSSMSDSRIFKVNPNDEYFIAGSLPYGYDIRDINKKQVEDAIKNLDFNKFKKQQIPVDIQTEYGNRVVNLDLKRIDKPSIKNLKKGGDNWVTIESADFDGEDLIDALKKMGYDGYYKQENGTKNLSVFSPDQIKSVNNSGAWSSSPSLSDAGWKAKPSLKDFMQGLNEFQEESFYKAISEGKKHSTSAKGTLGATHKAQEVLNDMIDASYDTKNPFKPRATTETRDLMQVKERLNQMLEPSGVKPLDESYSKAEALQSAFDKGYSFKPSDIKFSSLGLKTLREKRSFLQGYLRKVQENVLSDGGTNLADAIRKTENVLKEVLPDKKVDNIIGEANRINREFGRLKKLSQMADTTLDKPLAVERPASERWEGIGSWLGSLKDKASAKMWTDSNSRRALALLNGIAENQKRNIMESKLKRLAMLLGLSLNASIARQQNRK